MRILRWRGILDGDKRLLRVMVALVLVFAGIALSFVQLGFVNAELPGGTSGYVVVLLEVVALGALLLGTLPGTALGFAIGGVLFAHARILPLDHYELAFVTPTTSIVMFGVSGLILGVLFAFALRNNPSQVKRIIYLSIICIVTSWLYSLGFFANVIGAIIGGIAENLGTAVSETVAREAASASAMQFGDLGVQAWGTGLCMALVCIIADFLSSKAHAHKNTLGLRTVFAAWLGVVVALVFMVTSAVSFVVVTVDELWDAESNMDSDTSYLLDQIEESLERAKKFDDFVADTGFDYENLDDGAYESLMGAIDSNDLLNGLDLDKHGTAIVMADGTPLMTNDPQLSALLQEDEPIEDEVRDAIDTSAQEGHMVRLVRDASAPIAQSGTAAGEAGNAPEVKKPYIAFVVAAQERLDIGDNIELDFTVAIMMPSDRVFEKRQSIMTWMTVSSFILLLAVFVLVFLLVNRLVIRRIDEENEVLALITDGNLDTRAGAGGSREFESLSDGINVTVDALKGWIAEAETRMDAELAAARAIQESALPRAFPPYPDIPKFDVYASMNAAKQVGGDFYDFFLVGGDCGPESGKLAFVIADVSGKGVPAALFMMKAKALLGEHVGSGMDLGEAVEEANRALVDGNDEGMFVTAWVGVLDYATGHVDYVNAGHNPPLLRGEDGSWQWLREKSGVPLGLFDMPYQAHEIDCAVGDIFLLYTDGVTEALDVEGNLYGEDRLFAVAEKGGGLHPSELLESVRADVAVHARDAEQSDDITILALEVGVPPEGAAAS